MKQTAPQSVDEYIAGQPESIRPKLEQVRGAIRKAVPEALECIGYRMPGYKLHGKPMLYFAAFQEHYSLFAASGSFFATLKEELRGYEVGKGTVQFPLTRAVPVKLISRIAKLRAAGIASTVKKPAAAGRKDGELSPEQRHELLRALETRFKKNTNRHKGLEWAKVQAKLEANPRKLKSLREMERTGGEPDVIGHDRKTGEYIFCDCSPETPKGRRNVCYDQEAQKAREKQGLHPGGNVIDLAAAMGIEPLTEEQYRELQGLGEFDTKTQSWLKTPSDIRELGGAIFADRRFGHVFVYHNTAPCFYSGRGFRGSLRV